MKPLHLKIDGLACYHEEQEIDFTNLDLFAITGPTGSGKSTILDAMIFALYGVIPRIGKRGVSDMINLSRDRAAVLFDFAVGLDRYRISRTMRKAGANPVRLEKHDGNEYSLLLADAVKPARMQIEIILGMDPDTFRQAVILPQGEFAKFLKSDPRERRNTLTALLRLGIYERMRKKANSTQKDNAIQEENIQERLDEDYANVSEERKSQLESELEAKKKEHKEVEEKLEQLRKKKENLQLVVQLEDQLDLKCQKLDTELEKLRIAKEDNETFSAQAEKGAGEFQLLENKLKDGKDAVDACDHEPNRFETLSEARVKASGLVNKVTELEEAREEYKSKEDKLEAEKDLISGFNQKVETLTVIRDTRDQEKDTALKALEEAKTHNAAAALRADLTNGDVCPVCEKVIDELPAGHTHDLERAMQNATAAEKAATTAASELNAAIRAAENADSVWKANQQHLQSAKEQIDKKSALIVNERSEIEQALASLTPDQNLPIEEWLEGEWTIANSRKKRFEDADKALRQLEGDVAEKRRIQDKFASDRDEAKKEVTRLSEDIGVLRQDVKDLENQISQKMPSGIQGGAKEATTTLEKSIKDEEDRQTAVTGATGKLTEGLEQLEEKLKKLVNLKNDLKKAKAKKSVYKILANDLRNDRFQAYLLEESFCELVKGASERMFEFSAEQYSLAFENDEILVIDHDHAGERRPSDTLSGGETFLASLSLALELCEEVQRGAGSIRLDSLFIDEGFGSLSPETLQTVSDAIQRLQEQGRMIGVITHIPELKNEFGQRIAVKKTADGSRIEIQTD